MSATTNPTLEIVRFEAKSDASGHQLQYAVYHCTSFKIIALSTGDVIQSASYDQPSNVNAHCQVKGQLSSRYRLISRNASSRAQQTVTVNAGSEASKTTMAEVLQFHSSPDQVYTSRDPLNPSIEAPTIAIFNPGKEEVECEEIRFVVKRGSDPDDLTNNAATIVPLTLNADNWTIQKFSLGIFSAEPLPPFKGFGPKETVTFQFSQLQVNEVEGTGRIDVEVYFPDDELNTACHYNKIKSDLDVQFSINPPIINEGDTASLNWSTKAASRVTILPDGPEDPPLTGSFDVSPARTTTYYCTAYGTGPRVTKFFPLTVKESRVEIVELKATPDAVVLGAKTVIQWLIQNVETGTLSYDGQHFEVPANGEREVAIDKDTEFRLNAVKNGQLVEDIIQVNVLHAEILSFSASGSLRDKWGKISWETRYTTKVELIMNNGAPETVEASGSRNYPPTSPHQSYKLIAYGYDGSVERKINELYPPG